MKEKLIVEIDAKNMNVQIEVAGATGKRCLELTRFLEETLGPVRTRKIKAEGWVEKVRLRNSLRLHNKPEPR